MKILNHIIAVILLSVCAISCRSEDGILKIDVNYLEQNVSSAGVYVKIPVRASGSFTATIPSDARDWCHAEISGVYIALTVDPLTNECSRETSVTVSSNGCRDITINVHQLSVVVVDQPSEINLSNGLRTFSIRIISGSKLDFSYPDWIKPVDDEYLAGEKTYVFEAMEFDPIDTEKRTGNFIIKSIEAGFRLEIPIVQVAYMNSAIKTITELWKTNIFESSPLNTKSSRYSLLMELEKMCDNLTRDEFQAYLAVQDDAAKVTEQEKDILAIYNYAFEHVLSDVQSMNVESGTAVIWMLYNAGFIVKTPSSTFGIDINHRYAVKFAPILDFLCVSHSDNDHIDNALMNEMDRLGKPVLSNFHNANTYCSTSPTTYNIGDIIISTSITDENSTDLRCTTIHRIKCGEDTGGFEIIHTGDSSYDRTQFTDCLDGSSTKVLILRFGSSDEKNILGTLPGQVVPEYIIFSHTEELRHYTDKSPRRAAISQSIDNMKSTFDDTIAQGKCYLPFWGEKMVWKNGKLQ